MGVSKLDEEAREKLANFTLSTPFWEFQAEAPPMDSNKQSRLPFYSLLGVSRVIIDYEYVKLVKEYLLSTPFWEFPNRYAIGKRYELESFYSLLGVSVIRNEFTVSEQDLIFLLPFGSFLEGCQASYHLYRLQLFLSTPFWEFLQRLSQLLTPCTRRTSFLLPFGSFSRYLDIGTSNG